MFKAGGATNVTLAVAAAKESYAAGEPIMLTLTLTNAGDAGVCLSNTTAGTVALTSVTKDGAPVTTRTAPSYFLAPLGDMMQSALTEVAPGDTMTLSLTSSEDPGLGAAALSASALDDTRAMTTFYDVSAPGAYSVEVTYAYPGEPSAECAEVLKSATAPATATFTVTQ